MANGSLEALVKVLNNLPATMEAEIMQAERETLDDAYAVAYRLSSGPFDQQTLNLLDNPYAKRHGASLLDPQVINVQTGRFRAGWQTFGPTLASGGIVSSLTNFTPESYFLQPGTRFMWNRPIDIGIVESVTPRRLKRLNDAFANALKPLPKTT